MKKSTRVTALILLLLSGAQAQISAVEDIAKVLSSSQEKTLSDGVDAILEEYNFQVMFYLTDREMTESKLRVAAAGFGPNGAIFAVSTTSRKYYYVTAGTGKKIFGDYEFDEMDEQVLPYLRKNSWSGAAEAFLRACRDVLDESNLAGMNGSPAARRAVILGKLPIAAVIGAAAASIALFVMIAGMKTGHGRGTANEYVVDTELTRRSDVYLYTTQTRRRIETSSSSSGHSGGGGGGSFSSSSGTSYGGRGGSF